MGLGAAVAEGPAVAAAEQDLDQRPQLLLQGGRARPGAAQDHRPPAGPERPGHAHPEREGAALAADPAPEQDPDPDPLTGPDAARDPRPPEHVLLDAAAELCPDGDVLERERGEVVA